MSKVKRKFSVKTLIDKCNALRDIEKGISNKDVAVKYGVPKNTISTWVKNKETYFRALLFYAIRSVATLIKIFEISEYSACRTFAISNVLVVP